MHVWNSLQRPFLSYGMIQTPWAKWSPFFDKLYATWFLSNMVIRNRSATYLYTQISSKSGWRVNFFNIHSFLSHLIIRRESPKIYICDGSSYVAKVSNNFRAIIFEKLFMPRHIPTLNHRVCESNKKGIPLAPPIGGSPWDAPSK